MKVVMVTRIPQGAQRTAGKAGQERGQDAQQPDLKDFEIIFRGPGQEGKGEEIGTNSSVRGETALSNTTTQRVVARGYGRFFQPPKDTRMIAKPEMYSPAQATAFNWAEVLEGFDSFLTEGWVGVQNCETSKNQPISVHGIQKRMEYYTKKTNINMSCHHLRHTMATQMLNADADLETIQDLLGHSSI